MIDIHNHIIPGIDDGPADLADSLRMVEMAVEQGITRLVCTPHMHAGRYDNIKSTILPAFRLLQQAVARQGLPVQLAMAAEVRISDEFMVQLQQDQVPFVGRWQGKVVVLLEMPHERVSVGIDNLLAWLAKQNIQALIAHPERNKELMRRPELAAGLARRGALFQLTAASVSGDFGGQARKTADWILEKQLAFCVASDAHNTTHRPPALQKAYESLEARGGKALAEQLCIINPGLLTDTLF